MQRNGVSMQFWRVHPEDLVMRSPDRLHGWFGREELSQ